MNIKKSLNIEGYVFLTNIGIDKPTEDIAKTIGTVIKVPELSLVQTLRPTREENSTENVYSGNFGLGSFPLHSDLAHWYMPPRYLMLRSIVPCTEVYTSFIRTEDALSNLKSSTIRRAMFQPRKPIERRLPLLRFYQYGDTHNLYRWDQLFLNPANLEAVKISELFEFINNKHKYMKGYLKNEGDILIIDNWTMLHGRSNVTESGMKRVLERIYLSEIHK